MEPLPLNGVDKSRQHQDLMLSAPNTAERYRQTSFLPSLRSGEDRFAFRCQCIDQTKTDDWVCNYRLFDSRVALLRVPAAHADIIIMCPKCKGITAFTVIDDDDA
jgi:hypothetical protein